MSSRGTGTSSFTHRYCCLSRDPHSLCRRLKEIAWLASVAEKSFTGIETSPKETVSDAIARGAMRSLRFPSGRAVEQTLEALLAPQGVAPSISGSRQALGGVGDPEVERVRARELLPRQRHRHRRAGGAARRIRHVQRLAAGAHTVIQEDLACALRHAPFHRDVLRVIAHEVPPDQLADLAG